ncbi:MAG: ABC transporter permease [Deferribacteres bacterium]|nr:ABC transporter permease [Deferribacteres bacterium]
MSTLIYALQTAMKSIWNEKWINLLTVLSVSIGLLILSSFVTVTLNVDSALKRWAKGFGMVVYLDEDLTGKAENELKKLFLQDPDILEVRYISKEQAVRELRLSLGENASILDELDENPLPSSFELKLKRELLKPAVVKKKAEQISRLKGVEEVQYGEKWLSSLNTLSTILKTSAIFLGCAILVAIVFITYNTIKIFFYRRKDEIETLKLLGATRTFIRLPFLIEGLFIGIAGGLISAVALFGIHSMISFKGVEILPSIRTLMVAPPLQAYILIVLVGAVMSLTGSFIAVGRIRY